MRRTRPGRARIIACTPPGACPFCLDPLAPYKGIGRRPKTCGAPECIKASIRTKTRDDREQAKKAASWRDPWAWVEPTPFNWRPAT